MKRTIFGVTAILLLLGLLFMGCDSPVDLTPGEIETFSQFIPADAKEGGSGAGYAGWAYDEELFPAYNGPKNPFQEIEYNGVWRTS